MCILLVSIITENIRKFIATPLLLIGLVIIWFVLVSFRAANLDTYY